MKTKHYFLILLISGLLFSCDKKEAVKSDLSADQKELIIDEALQSSVIDDLLNDIDSYSELGEGLLKSAQTEEICPVITIEKPESKPFWPRTVTLDFGDGCDKSGKMKSGKIIMEKSAPWREPGAERKVTFENYVVDGVSIEGTKTLTNISEEGENPTFKIEADLVFTFTNKNDEEVVVSRKIEKTQEWLAGYRDKDVKKQVVLSGESKVVKKIGDDEKNIEKTFDSILLVAGCRFPQDGITKFEVNTFDGDKLEFVLDYATTGVSGDKCSADCDCTATLIVDDVSEDIDLSERWRNNIQSKD